MTDAETAGRPLSPTSPIVLLGAGRLGLHLAFHLRVAGATDLTLWNRSPLPPARAALLEIDAATPTPGSSEAVSSPAPAFYTGGLPLEALSRARLVLLTVVDDALPPLAETLAAEATLPADCPVLHCSGALSSGVLEPLAARGVATGSAHPLQSFSGVPRAGGLEGTWFAVEGAPSATEAGERLVGWVGGRIVRLRPEGKVLYHTSAVVASNLLVALVSHAVDLLGEATGPEVEAGERLEVLLPLIEGTVANLRRVGLPGALTGPVSRGDAGVVARQLAALAAPQSAEDRLTLYRLLSRRAVEIARAQGLPEPQAAAIDRLLSGPFPANDRLLEG